MPATSASRRKSAPSKAKAQGQTKLAFHGSASRNTATDVKKEEEVKAKIEKVEIKLEDEPYVLEATPEVEEPKPIVKAKPTDDKNLFPEGLSTLDLDADELALWKTAIQKARKMSQAQVTKYWKEKEKNRGAPRIHQEKMSMEEKILADWDVDSRFGVSLPPCFNACIFSRDLRRKCGD
jgi:DNA polymerase delta subunit 4